VRVQTADARMENALQVQWNEAGKILAFYNWYGQAPG